MMPAETFDQMNARIAAEVRAEEIDEGIEPTRALETLNYQQMTPTQRASSCKICGRTVSTHIDGWDGNWLGCDEAARRHSQ